MAKSKQYAVYEFIKAFIKQHGYSPSLTEIAAGVGVSSKSLISRYVHGLTEAGMIDLVAGERRAIRLKSSPQPQIPVIGRIAAGQPIEAIAEADALDVVQLLTEHARSRTFALVVKGDSMVGEGILEGDMVLCEQRDTAEDGDIVVALIDKREATLKRFYLNKNGTITLAPANITLKSQIYAADRVTIQGIFRGLIRLSR